jgi:hypothetical protein
MAEILGESVRLSSPVIKIDQTGEEAVITTEHGQTYSVGNTPPAFALWNYCLSLLAQQFYLQPRILNSHIRIQISVS